MLLSFSKDNGIIEVTLTSEADEAIFSVRDYGIGIPKEMHKKIFEPYYQISNTRRSMEGMGLGLPIVKKINTDLSGVIKVNSDLQKFAGTAIIVNLPKYDITKRPPAIQHYLAPTLCC